MSQPAREYVDARSVLLDALEALAPHRDSLVLVGAQAVYLRTGDLEGTGIPMTTDSDLVLDADLLGDDPELTEALRAAKFTPAKNLPGQWEGRMGVRVDLMTVPHQSNRPDGKRAADLTPHGKESARITPGLEPALLDNSVLTIRALDEDDDRAIELRVAGPAALLTAKLIKLAERHEEAVAKGKVARLKDKDALDCYRLLYAIQTKDLVAGFESHRAGSEALAATVSGLRFFAEQHQQGENGVLRKLLIQALPDEPTAPGGFDSLSGDLLAALPDDILNG